MTSGITLNDKKRSEAVTLTKHCAPAARSGFWKATSKAVSTRSATRVWPYRLADATSESRKKWWWSLLSQMLRSKEAAIAQNVSARGMRVATEHVWRPGDSVLLSSPEFSFRTQARVVYCQRLENNMFAVGLELLTPLREGAKPR